MRKGVLSLMRLGRVAASLDRVADHHAVTAVLVVDFHDCLVGGSDRMIRGSGREYCLEMALTWENQDLGVVRVRAARPCLKRMLEGPSLAIMCRRDNCLRCRDPDIGMLPARKYTADLGVVAGSRRILCTVTLW